MGSWGLRIILRARESIERQRRQQREIQIAQNRHRNALSIYKSGYCIACPHYDNIARHCRLDHHHIADPSHELRCSKATQP